MNAAMSPERDRRKRSRPRSVSAVVPADNPAATLAEQLEALAARSTRTTRRWCELPGQWAT